MKQQEDKTQNQPNDLNTLLCAVSEPELKFNAVYSREVDFTKNSIAVQQVHDLMSLFNITKYKIDKSKVYCDYSQAKLPNKKLSFIENQFARLLNL